MAIRSSNIAWGITLLAAGGIYWMLRRKQNSTPTLLEHPEYNMETNDKLPLGYRSNNPLNIRYSPVNNWMGKVLPPAEGKYGLYERFKDLAHGYRAALVLLRGKGYILGGNNTIRKIITRWAPEDDHNYTDNYIAHVSNTTGIDPDRLIARNDKDALTSIVYAMSIVENGYKDADKNDIKEKYGLPNMEIINAGWELM